MANIYTLHYITLKNLKRNFKKKGFTTLSVVKIETFKN